MLVIVIIYSLVLTMLSIIGLISLSRKDKEMDKASRKISDLLRVIAVQEANKRGQEDA